MTNKIPGFRYATLHSIRATLAETEKTLSRVIFEQMGSHESFGLIRSKGDLALFNKSTQAMKILRGV